ncbi:MAG: DNA translocase FtsK [Thermodesulfobacteriota bacterium]
MDSLKTKQWLLKEIIGVALLGIALFLFFSLISYFPGDPSINVARHSGSIENWGGMVGSYISDLLLTSIGLSAYILPVVFIIFALEFIIMGDLKLQFFRPIGFFLLLFSLSGMLSILFGEVRIFGVDIPSGGLIGKGVHSILEGYLNMVGAFIVLFFFLIISTILTTGFSFLKMLSYIGRVIRAIYLWFINSIKKMIERWKMARRLSLKDKTLKKERRKAAPKIVASSVTHAETKKEVKEPPLQEPFEFLKLEGGDFHLPPLSLLDSVPPEESSLDRDSIFKRSDILENKLKDFGIAGKVVEVHPGPVITLYEYEPAPGVKINQIVNLADDLTMALRALNIRIVAPIPGKSVIGIEVPNAQRQNVYLKEIMESKGFSKSPSKLSLALGKDISGHPVTTDLSRMPHLLVAGATGAGKSVSLNTMILSMLYKATPQEVRFVMIDPKMLEFSSYESIPHQLLPLVTDPKKAIATLKGVILEMEDRYRTMAEKGARNLLEYNNKLLAEGEQERKLPYIVVIIDELADLMMVSSKELENCIIRLAQKARAAGIHLIVATQRPSVDVVTGLIKANFPARISFQVASKADARTILDANGAERLVGRGDMLFLLPGTSKIQRLHGAYVSEQEIKRVVQFLEKQKRPDYDISLIEMETTEEENEDEEAGFDEKYDLAIGIVTEKGLASISFIQRRLRIGYNRAARIIERMEKEGIIGPSDGSRPREVLIKK